MTERVQIKLGASPGPDNHVVINGVDVVNRIRGLSLSANRDGVPTLTLEYECVDGINWEGDVFVHHNCPL